MYFSINVVLTVTDSYNYYTLKPESNTFFQFWHIIKFPCFQSSSIAHEMQKDHKHKQLVQEN